MSLFNNNINMNAITVSVGESAAQTHTISHKINVRFNLTTATEFNTRIEILCDAAKGGFAI
jgi:hypothetical protein